MTAMLAGAGRRRHFDDGATIQQQGDEGDGFWLVVSGRVVVCRFAETGDVTVFAVLGPGDLFGELAYFAQVPRQVDAVAEGNVELSWIGAALVDRLLADEPAFAQWLLRSLAHQLRTALDRVDRDRRLSAHARLARVLSDIAVRDGPAITATQQDLADLVGVSRVTTGQALARFAESGLIERGYGRITLCDPVGLEALAAGL
ncbi:Crp/Fnr family transcriptional regulator [Novosphingobium tardum]|uniref:Crp/Fnr family transcriptional regulator n=1 Tax=Novosphingobium tardum TaxID=1538021 RepID=A0ABV8RUM0_9SPHN